MEHVGLLDELHVKAPELGSPEELKVQAVGSRKATQEGVVKVELLSQRLRKVHFGLLKAPLFWKRVPHPALPRPPSLVEVYHPRQLPGSSSVPFASSSTRFLHLQPGRPSRLVLDVNLSFFPAAVTPPHLLMKRLPSLGGGGHRGIGE